MLRQVLAAAAGSCSHAQAAVAQQAVGWLLHPGRCLRSSSHAALCAFLPHSPATAWPAQWVVPAALHQQQLQQRAALATAAPKRAPTMPMTLRTVIKHAKQQQPERPDPPPLKPRPLQFESRRSGVIAIKAGMTQEWDEYGVRVPLTVLWVDDCQVLRHKHAARDGVTSLVLACGAKRAKQLNPAMVSEYAAWGLPLKRKLWEVKVSEDALLPSGTALTAAHFVAGQYVDVTGVTKGKGFAGVMKRWNFKGQGASHGNSKHHRAPGAIGGRTDPGRVWKGKKMAGHLGCEQQTFKNLWVYKVDPSRNLVYVRGAVPGPQGSFILLRDAFRWRWPERQACNLPFPTHLGEAPPVTVATRPGMDPYLRYRQDLDFSEAKWAKTD